MSEAEKHLAEHLVDIILLDLGLPDAQGLGAVRRAHAAAPRVPVVVLTGLDDEALATQALQEGAQDYLIKGQIETRGLLRALRYAIERKIMEEALVRGEGTRPGHPQLHRRRRRLHRHRRKYHFPQSGCGKNDRLVLAEASGRPMTEVLRILDATTRETTPNPMELAVGQHSAGHLPSNCILIRRDGFEIPIEDSVAPIHDREGQATGAVIVFRDVSAARAMAVQMIHSAQHDFLTGLPNRMLLNDRVNQAITSAARRSKKVAVLFLDLDGFKHINDSLGHPIGDKLLQSIAKRLVTCVRGSDTVSRQGGDEFVVLLSEVEQQEDAAITALRLLRSGSRGPFHRPSRSPRHHQHRRERLSRRRAGRGDAHQERGHRHVPGQGKWPAELSVFQARHERSRRRAPIHRRESAPGAGAQGILIALPAQDQACHGRDHRSGSPDTLDPSDSRALSLRRNLFQWRKIAASFCPSVTGFFARRASKPVPGWTQGLPLGTMAVNISSMEFREDRFLESVFTTLDETGLDPKFLELELTESVLMKRAESAASVLKELRARGVQVAVDDFGTGYSSLSYLRKFPIDALKIDQSFVRQITSAPDDTTIVTAVISMGRSLKLRVVAEGVETREELEFLRAQQCDEAQGYFFSKPVPPRQFGILLKSGISESAVIVHR